VCFVISWRLQFNQFRASPSPSPQTLQPIRINRPTETPNRRPQPPSPSQFKPLSSQPLSVSLSRFIFVRTGEHITEHSLRFVYVLIVLIIITIFGVQFICINITRPCVYFKTYHASNCPFNSNTFFYVVILCMLSAEMSNMRITLI